MPRFHPLTSPLSEWPIPDEHLDTDKGTLLTYVAQRTAEVVQEHAGGGGAKPVVGFCFSFPVEQTAVDNGRVVVWTKVGGRVVAAHGTSV